MGNKQGKQGSKYVKHSKHAEPHVRHTLGSYANTTWSETLTVIDLQIIADKIETRYMESRITMTTEFTKDKTDADIANLYIRTTLGGITKITIYTTGYIHVTMLDHNFHKQVSVRSPIWMDLVCIYIDETLGSW